MVGGAVAISCSGMADVLRSGPGVAVVELAFSDVDSFAWVVVQEFSLSCDDERGTRLIKTFPR